MMDDSVPTVRRREKRLKAKGQPLNTFLYTYEEIAKLTDKIFRLEERVRSLEETQGEPMRVGP
jgi:hypothetical protein